MRLEQMKIFLLIIILIYAFISNEMECKVNLKMKLEIIERGDTTQGEIQFITVSDSNSYKQDNSQLQSFPLKFFEDYNYRKSLIKISITANKLCYLHQNENIVEYCIGESSTPDVKVLLIEDYTLLKAILFYNENNGPKTYFYVAYICRSDTLPVGDIQLQQNIQNPFFHVDASDFQEMKELLLKINFPLDVKFKITYDNSRNQLPVDYVNICYAIYIPFCAIIFVFWHFQLIRHRKHFTGIQKVGMVLLYVKSIIIGIFTYYISAVVAYNEKFSFEPNFRKNMYEIIILMITSIYKTILWIFLLLLAHGWKICYSTLHRDEIRKFLWAYFGIYFLICLDPILDLYISKVGVFKFSEIKEMICVTLIAGIVLWKLWFVFHLMKWKLSYSLSFAPEFTQTLVIKLYFLRTFGIIVLAYLCLYLLTQFSFQAFYSKSEHFSDFVKNINVNNIEWLFLTALLVLLRPRPLPANFEIELNTHYSNSIKAMQVYSIDLSNEDSLVTDLKDYLTQHRKALPLIIENPFPGESESGNAYVDNLYLGYIQ